MSAITHSPGFFDVVRQIAGYVQPVASIASLIPGIAPFAAPIALAAGAISEGGAGLLTSLPAQSVVTTVPQVAAAIFEEEGGDEEVGPPPRGYATWEDYYADPERG